MAQMRTYRRMAQDRYGQAYESRVAPFRSLIVQQYWRYNGSRGPLEIGQEFVGLLRGRGKTSPHLAAAVYAAALDVVERNLHATPPPNRQTPPDDVLVDGMELEE